jgi:hypothetical protein
MRPEEPCSVAGVIVVRRRTFSTHLDIPDDELARPSARGDTAEFALAQTQRRERDRGGTALETLERVEALSRHGVKDLDCGILSASKCGISVSSSRVGEDWGERKREVGRLVRSASTRSLTQRGSCVLPHKPDSTPTRSSSCSPRRPPGTSARNSRLLFPTGRWRNSRLPHPGPASKD